MSVGWARRVSRFGREQRTQADHSWDVPTGDLLNANYFVKDTEGKAFNFMEDFWKGQSHVAPLSIWLMSVHYETYVKRLRQAQPDAISFLNPPVFGSPPTLSEEVKQGRIAVSVVRVAIR